MTLIKLYTYEERQEIWNNLANEIHPFNLEERSKEELLKYAHDLEEYAHRIKNERNYFYNIGRKGEYYKNLAHTYKVELGRCRRKLTRIYKALDDVEINMIKEFLLRYDTAIVLWLMELIKSIKKLLKSI